MPNSMLVRASRDGDQFHYLWAARRALRLLAPQSGLVEITIEGPSTSELQPGKTLEGGEELIDIAEYYGSTAIDRATLVRYMQLKHSTLHADEAWAPSGLEKTISGFAKRYRELCQQFRPEALQEKLEFWFVTNRPIGKDFTEAVEDAATQSPPRHPNELQKLKIFTSFDGIELASFCKIVRFEAGEDDYWTQRNILSQDVSGYLPELDVDAPTRLKELVTCKALSESAANPGITKTDVLRALRTDESQLFPARCLIETIDMPVPREQEPELIRAIVGAVGRPVIVQADAGVGKSIFSTRITMGLPKNSVTILYDCFGNGEYRSATGYRHRHRTALVQIANELSALGLCHPLIPTVHADASAYMRAFIHRLKQSVSVLHARSTGSVLCIVVDAADNAQMAAEEIGEPRSFVRDLLREKLPDGVRLVALCRPHREAMLNPPPHKLSLLLTAFTRSETADHLRARFPTATEHDVDEFHRLSSQNPRVQALALSRQASLPEILRLLGPNPTTVESAIGALLEKSIATLRDAAGQVEGNQIDLICAGLAALRPLIPISVLGEMSGVDRAAIKSFALDLGRPLIVGGDSIQFFDEPAETWFRDRFRPDTAKMATFVVRLEPLASRSAYVASALPQLMLEAGQFDDLVQLALSSSGLPETSPVERRDVELQRLQFALKASLRVQRYADAAKLALKAGGETAGHDRQRRLLQSNTDLAGVFMDSNSVQELVSRRTFGSGWVGSHHVYEAAVLSSHVELKGDARSRLRMAEEWLRNWSKLSPDEREIESVSDEDRAVMTMAHFNVHGARAAARSLRAWRPRELSYRAGVILARRFLDHGRYNDLEELALAADNDIGLIFAIAVEMRNLHRLIPKDAVLRGFKLLADRRIEIKDAHATEGTAISAVMAMVENAYRHGLCDATTGKALLDRYLPPTPPLGLSSEHSTVRADYMRASALRAALGGMSLKLEDLAAPELRKEMEAKKQHSESHDLRKFNANVGALLPWYTLWARAFLGQVSEGQLPQAIVDAQTMSTKADASLYREEAFGSNEMAGLWIDILLDAGSADETSIAAIIEWSKSLKRQLYTPTLLRLAHLSARTKGSGQLAFEFAQIAFSLLRDERSDAQNKADGYVDVARSLLTISRSEAEAYFNQAVDVASKIGDENIARWDAIINLAERSARTNRPLPETAYKFSRCAEVSWDYVVRDKHFAWHATIEALVGLCPSSSLAIASRWRDRRFGYESRVLALTIEALVARGSISPLDALPLVGFHALWDDDELVEAALPLCNDASSKAAAIYLIYRYLTLETPSVKKWRRLEAIAGADGIGLSHLTTYLADSVATETVLQNAHTATPADRTEDRNWDEVFDGCDVTTAEGIADAHRRFRGGDPPLYTETFFREAIERIPVGKEGEFLAAFGAVSAFEPTHLRYLLEAVPPEWKGRLGTRSALATLVKGFCRRFCMVIRQSRYYEPLPFKLACDLSGLSESDLFDVVLSGIGESAELADSDRLFSLVGLLATKLTSDESLDVLSYGLDLFDIVLEDIDGDGPWSSQLMPPVAVEDALAGYIWAGLASPIAATRWEAAHVVVGLCAMGRARVIAALIGYASSGSTKPFGDLRFTFYSLHAQQWLLIAMARAALDHATALTPHVDYLLENATVKQPHVLIRLFAARALLTMDEQRVITLSADVRQQLIDINVSPFESIKRDAFREHAHHDPNVAAAEEELPEPDRYFFGIDFGPYWLAPLGRCFGMSQVEVERETLKTIRGQLGYAGSRCWEADERGRRRLYRYEEGTHHSHGSYPRIDDYGFYLSYHAMMLTAGRLLATRPLVAASNEWEEDSVWDWIGRHDISRADGRWLADRCDPLPPGVPYRFDDKDRTAWFRSIGIGDFDCALYPGTGYLAVWGQWSDIDASQVQSISVHSALVQPERSASLLRALQTVDDPHDFRIPDANDDHQIDEGPYQLKGWIVDRPRERGIDEMDRWSGEVRFPAPEPAPFVVEIMKLSTDSDRRLWQIPGVTTPLLRSETWGRFPDRDGSEEPNGRRLRASIPFVIKFLNAVGMDLVVEVEIQRRSSYGRYTGHERDELGNNPPSNKLFIVKGDGTIRTL